MTQGGSAGCGCGSGAGGPAARGRSEARAVPEGPAGGAELARQDGAVRVAAALLPAAGPGQAPERLVRAVQVLRPGAAARQARLAEGGADLGHHRVPVGLSHQPT